jgi:hypothetical protein
VPLGDGWVLCWRLPDSTLARSTAPKPSSPVLGNYSALDTKLGRDNDNTLAGAKHQGTRFLHDRTGLLTTASAGTRPCNCRFAEPRRGGTLSSDGLHQPPHSYGR